MENKQIFVNEICPTSTQSWIKKGALLVDVREQDEVAQLAFDVPNLINIPLSEFENRCTELPLDQNLVIVCRSGSKSFRATGFLIYNGYDAAKVVNMKHGIIRWVQKGYPTRGDTSIVADVASDKGCCGTGDHNSEKKSCCSSHNSNDSKCC
jgi:rhodanese-related sulfurtransferase